MTMIDHAVLDDDDDDVCLLWNIVCNNVSFRCVVICVFVCNGGILLLFVVVLKSQIYLHCICCCCCAATTVPTTAIAVFAAQISLVFVYVVQLILHTYIHKYKWGTYFTPTSSVATCVRISNIYITFVCASGIKF